MDAGLSELPRERGDPDLRPRVLRRLAGQSVLGSLSLDGHSGGLELRVPGGGIGGAGAGVAQRGRMRLALQGEAQSPPA